MPSPLHQWVNFGTTSNFTPSVQHVKIAPSNLNTGFCTALILLVTTNSRHFITVLLYRDSKITPLNKLMTCKNNNYMYSLQPEIYTAAALTFSQQNQITAVTVQLYDKITES